MDFLEEVRVWLSMAYVVTQLDIHYSRALQDAESKHRASSLRRSQFLSQSQVRQDLLASTADNQHTQISGNLLDRPSHSTTLIARSTEHLLRLSISQLQDPPAMDFREGNPASHIAVPSVPLDVICDLLYPRPVRLYVAGKRDELVADDLVGNERSSKGVAGMGVVQRHGEALTGFAVHVRRHDQPFCVEVFH